MKKAREDILRDIDRIISNDSISYIVRLYDGFDNEWMDISKAVSGKEAKSIWLERTNDGTKNTEYSDIDYYSIFPSHTKMLYSPDY